MQKSNSGKKREKDFDSISQGGQRDDDKYQSELQSILQRNRANSELWSNGQQERHFSNPTYQVIGKELDLFMQNIKKMF